MDNPLQHVMGRLAAYSEAHPRASVSKRAGVRSCQEFERIDSLPRRSWSDAEAEELARLLTPLLRIPGGRQTLRPIQAIALYEIAENGGGLFPIRVGGGKTLISLLAPVILGSVRPLLVLPAKLIPKTRQNILECAVHWKVCTTIRIVSYDLLGRTQAASLLAEYSPDLIILDEAQRARNRKAAVTRRLVRYCEKVRPACVILSGTLIRKRLLDWAHLADFALSENSPAPRKWNTIAHWGSALDVDATITPGVLGRWQEPGEGLRAAYRRRVVATPGVVATTEGLLGVSLTLEAWRTELPLEVEQALVSLAGDWMLPDGYQVTDPLHYYRAARQLSLGVYYRYREQPPAEWVEARRNWARMVRHACRYLRVGGKPFDSEKQVALAIQSGRVEDTMVDPDTGRPVTPYATWRRIRPTFDPIIEHVWVTHDIVERLIAEARDGLPAIVWTESVAVGRAMHARGLTWYGAKGLSPDRRSILAADPSLPFAASIQSAGEGQNLQAWSRAIVSSPSPDAVVWEQMLGRIHRDGQQADECEVKVAMLGAAHEQSWEKAIGHARFLQETTGQEQKLLQATLIDLPDQ